MFRAFLLLETGMKEPGRTPAVLLVSIVRYWVDFSKGGDLASLRNGKRDFSTFRLMALAEACNC